MADMTEERIGVRSYANLQQAQAYGTRLDLAPISLSPVAFDVLALLQFRAVPLTSKAIERQLQCAYILDWVLRMDAEPDNKQKQLIQKAAAKVHNSDILELIIKEYYTGGIPSLASYLLRDDKKLGARGIADVKRIRAVAAINELTHAKIPSSAKINTALKKLNREYIKKTAEGWAVIPSFRETWTQRKQELMHETDVRAERIIEQASKHKLDISGDDYLTPEEKEGFKPNITEVDDYAIKKLTEYYTPSVMDFYLLYWDKNREFSSTLVKNLRHMRYFT